jgi:hypothetical protein
MNPTWWSIATWLPSFAIVFLDSVKKGLTLDQVKASRPTADYDPRYGSNADQFIESVYRSLGGKV